MGYGWFIRKRLGRDVIDVNGRIDGFTSSLTHFLHDDVVVATLSNNTSGLSSEMADAIAALVLGDRVARPQVSSLHVDPALGARLVGSYQFGADFYYSPSLLARVELDPDGRMRMQVGAPEPTYLFPQPDGRFLDRVFGGEIRFVGDGARPASELRWNVGHEFVAPRAAP
jgi:hypothetical protein